MSGNKTAEDRARGFLWYEWTNTDSELEEVQAVTDLLNAERELCCKAVCRLCRLGSHPLIKHRGKLLHHKTGKAGYYACLAEAIRKVK